METYTFKYVSYDLKHLLQPTLLKRLPLYFDHFMPAPDINRMITITD